MIFEFDSNRGLFVARSKGPKKRSGGGCHSPEIGIRRMGVCKTRTGYLRMADADEKMRIVKGG